MALTGNNHNVSWSDFRHIAKRPNGVNEDAEIHVQFPYQYKTGRDKGATKIISADMRISTIPGRCWGVTGQMTTDLLEHEQGHYDITVIGAKEFYNILIGLSAKSEHELEKLIRKENDKIQTKVNDTNKRYDAQTNHSRNATAQHTWDQRIAGEKQKPRGSIVNLP